MVNSQVLIDLKPETRTERSELTEGKPETKKDPATFIRRVFYLHLNNL
jgi:hypothetical protein